MLLFAGSLIIAVLSVLSLWLIERGSRTGWLVGLITQIIAIPYDILTHQLPMLGLVSALSWVYARKWALWHKVKVAKVRA
jgi:hypothetical protein